MDGSAVARMVESIDSMNSAAATTNGRIRSGALGTGTDGGENEFGDGLNC